MERYIGLDVSSTSCTFGVIGPSGKHLKSAVVETNGKALVEFVKLIPGRRHLCLEEGTQSEWLYEILSPHVEEIVVTTVDQSRGQKSDKRDAFGLAEQMRVGGLQTRVFKNAAEYGRLRDLARAYAKIVSDVVRSKNRLKSIYRSRGLMASGKDIYDAEQRATWIAKLPLRARTAAELLFEEHDAIAGVRSKVEKELVGEARKHPIMKVLETAPGMGPIRVAQLLPVVVAPERFRTKRQFWSYCGLGIVTRSSSDWAKAADGGWVRAKSPMTRGLNRNHNHTLKYIFKGAASTVIGRGKGGLYEDYQRLLGDGVKPPLAKLTIARKIAAITLAMWKSQEAYDPEKHKKQT